MPSKRTRSKSLTYSDSLNKTSSLKPRSVPETRRYNVSHQKKLQTRNLKLYELGNDFIPKFFKGTTERDINNFILYLIDNLDLLCGAQKKKKKKTKFGVSISREIIKYFNTDHQGKLKIFILYNEDKSSKIRKLHDNIKAFAIASEHLTRGDAHNLTTLSEAGELESTELSGDLQCFRDGYTLDTTGDFKPYLFVHYLCGMAPMIMPDIFSSVRQIDRENKAAPVSSFLKKTFTSRKYRQERMKRIRLFTKKQKVSIRNLPRDANFKGVGKVLLNSLATRYTGNMDFIYLDAINHKKTYDFYKSNGYNPIYSNTRNRVYKSFRDTVSMIKLLHPDECERQSLSVRRSTLPRSSTRSSLNTKGTKRMKRKGKSRKRAFSI